jgi:hypothetical protein
MKSLKLCAGTLVLGAMTMLTSCRTGAASPGAAPPPAEILQKQYLDEIARYLYRWRLDDSEIEKIYDVDQIVFWVRRLNPQLDAGDNSILAEILLPQLNIGVKVKKADYRIEEMGVTVKSRSFRVTRVMRGHLPRHRPAEAVEVKIPLSELRDYLFQTRNRREYPDAALIEHLRTALHERIRAEGIESTNMPATDQAVYLAPLSPVANEVWAFWEDRRILFYFASDVDLTNPAVWDYESVMVRIFDIDQQVVGSHEEAPGSNRFLTRNQVGRLLYNCVVLGRKITVTPREAPPAGAGQTPSKDQ